MTAAGTQPPDMAGKALLLLDRPGEHPRGAVLSDLAQAARELALLTPAARAGLR